MATTTCKSKSVVATWASAFVAALLLMGSSFTALAGTPYCALRDPSHQIYEMFPNATSYRSVVREINADVREEVGEHIPFPLFGNELGQHTIYVPLNETAPLGFVHVRSERSEWGLIEIAWALNPNLEIRNFNYQRCRGGACKSVLKKGLAQLLTGKNHLQLTSMLAAQEKGLQPRTGDFTTDEFELARATLMSAIKTIAVTEQAWGNTVAQVREAYKK